MRLPPERDLPTVCGVRFLQPRRTDTPLDGALRELERVCAAHRVAVKKTRSAATAAVDALERAVRDAAKPVERSLAPSVVEKLSRSLELGDRYVKVNGKRYLLDPSVRAWTDRTGNLDVEQGWVFKSEHDRRRLYLHVEGPDWHEVAEFRGAGGKGMIGADSNNATLSEVLMGARHGGDHLIAVMQFAGQVSITARAAAAAARRKLHETSALEQRAADAAFASWYAPPDESRRDNAQLADAGVIRTACDAVRAARDDASAAPADRAKGDAELAKVETWLDTLAPIAFPEPPRGRSRTHWGAYRHVPTAVRAAVHEQAVQLFERLGDDETALCMLCELSGRTVVAATQRRVVGVTAGAAELDLTDASWSRDGKTGFCVQTSSGERLAGLQTCFPSVADAVMELHWVASRSAPAEAPKAPSPAAATDGLQPGDPLAVSPNPSETSTADSVLETIRKLGGLRDAGLLSDEEFETKKAELLRRL